MTAPSAKPGRRGRRLALGLVVIAGELASPIAIAQELPATTAAVTPDHTSEIETYCANIADAARDRRYLRQKTELEDLQVKIEDRIKVLEERRDEYKKWLARREEFIVVAEKTLVEIYKKMRADSAAEQLELLSPGIAAAIVMKLDARQSSQILNEMTAEKAATLAGIIADSASKAVPGDPS